MKKTLQLRDEDIGKRLDTVIAGHLHDTTRSQIKKWIDEGCVSIDGKIQKASFKGKSGDIVTIEIAPPKEPSAEPQNIPLDIIYEDPDIIVVNKSADMVVHPAPGNADGTLVNALLYHCKDLSGIGGVLRPGIVHRLDKGTSGVIIAAKNDAAHLTLSQMFKDRRMRKIYYALIYGVPKSKKGTFDWEIGRHKTERKKMSTKTKSGRTAVTNWEIVESFGKYISFVKIELITGRTHQIRVHFSANGMPLLGDSLYGGGRVTKRLPEGELRKIGERALRPMLHAASLEISHPSSGEEMLFEAPIPDDFKEILEALRGLSY